MTDYKAGDKLRLVIEAEVLAVDYDGLICLDNDLEFYADELAEIGIVSLEKIAQPFKPGDVVTPKDSGVYRYLLVRRSEGPEFFDFLALDNGTAKVHENGWFGPSAYEVVVSVEVDAA